MAFGCKRGARSEKKFARIPVAQTIHSSGISASLFMRRRWPPEGPMRLPSQRQATRCRARGCTPPPIYREEFQAWGRRIIAVEPVPASKVGIAVPGS